MQEIYCSGILLRLAQYINNIVQHVTKPTLGLCIQSEYSITTQQNVESISPYKLKYLEENIFFSINISVIELVNTTRLGSENSF